MPRPKSFRRATEQKVRRGLIVEAAERVFGRRPFDEATMQEIAEEAGLGMGAVYRHFTSKDELYDEIVLTRLDEIHQRLQTSGEPHSDVKRRLHELAAAYAGYFLERPHFFPVWATRRLSRDWGQKTRHGKALEERLEEIDREVLQAIGAGAKRGVFRTMGAQLVARLAIAVFSAVLEDHLLRRDKPDADSCATEMVDLLLRGVGAR